MKRSNRSRDFFTVGTTCTTCAVMLLYLSNIPCGSALVSPQRQSTTAGKKNNAPKTAFTSSKKSKTIKLHMANFIQLYTDPDTTADESIENSKWLSWMTGGTPRGVADVKMRDPEELGGVPRSDRYASRDWLHNTINLPNSRILREIMFPVTFMTIWGTLIGFVHKKLLAMGKTQMAANMCIPPNPHSLMVSALGLLLVFRTNSAYQRFAEGRKIWEEILSVARDLSRLVKLYEPQLGTSKSRRVNRLIAAFPYLLRFRIRPNSIMRKIDDPNVQRDPGNSLILYQDHGTFFFTDICFFENLWIRIASFESNLDVHLVNCPSSLSSNMHICHNLHFVIESTVS